MEGSINLITATGSVPLENYLTTVVGNVGSKIASAQFADDDCISFPSVSLVESVIGGVLSAVRDFAPLDAFAS